MTPARRSRPPTRYSAVARRDCAATGRTATGPRSRPRRRGRGDFVVASLAAMGNVGDGRVRQSRGNSVTFTACDPGVKAVGLRRTRSRRPSCSWAVDRALRSVSPRKRVPAPVARCVARLFALSPGALVDIGPSRPRNASARRTKQVRRASCNKTRSRVGTIPMRDCSERAACVRRCPATRRRRWSTTRISKTSIRTT